MLLPCPSPSLVYTLKKESHLPPDTFNIPGYRSCCPNHRYLPECESKPNTFEMVSPAESLAFQQFYPATATIPLKWRAFMPSIMDPRILFQ